MNFSDFKNFFFELNFVKRKRYFFNLSRKLLGLTCWRSMISNFLKFYENYEISVIDRNNETLVF